MLKRFLHSGFRALMVQFRPAIIGLSLAPSIVALALWGVLLFCLSRPLMQYLEQFLMQQGGDMLHAKVVQLLQFAMLKFVLVPVIGMWLLLPLVFFTTVFFVSGMAMPFINRFISRHYYKDVACLGRGSWWGSVFFALLSLGIFVVLWIISFPFMLVFHIRI